MKDSIQQLKYSTIISYGAIIFSIFAGLIYTPWMINQIGKDDFGLYSLVTIFISYFLIDFGLGQVVSTYIAKCRAAHDDKLLKKVLGVCYKSYLIITCVIALILIIIFFFISNIFSSLTPEQCGRFKVIYCIAGFFSVISFPLMPLNGIIIAYEKLIIIKLIDFVQKILCIILIIICLVNGWGLYSLITVNSAMLLLSGLIKLYYVKHHLNLTLKFDQRLDYKLLQELIQFSFWVFLMGIAQRFIIGASPTILGATSGAGSIAIFSIAMTLEGYVWMFSNAINGLFIPKVAQYVEADFSSEQLTDKMIQVGRVQLMIIGTLIGGIICLGYPFIYLWVGIGFTKSYIITILIVLPQLILVTQEIANSLFWIKNKIKYRSIIYIIGSLVSVTVSCAIAQDFGAVGCGIGAFVGLCIICIILNIYLKKSFDIMIERFYKQCHLKLLPQMCLPILIILIINHYIQINNWGIFCIIAFIYIVLEVIIILINLNNNEKDLILPIFRIRR